MANASSEKQVKKMASKEERLGHQEAEDIKAVMSSVHGRRFVWRLLSHCKAFASVFHPSGSQTYYNSGMQDVGHFILSEVTKADQKKYFEMQIEAKDYENV